MDLRKWPGYAEKWAYLAGLKPRQGLCLPDFLGIGAAKCGTTWLHRVFFKHPEIFVPVKKPVWYFDRHFDHPLAEYARIFEKAGAKLKGELTATYSTMPAWRIAFLRKVMPDLKIILIFRHPVKRAWSDAKMELTVIQRRPKESLTEQDFIREVNRDQCRQRGNYPAILKNWLRFFPRKQIYTGIFEEMVRRPRDILTEIFSFLGVSVPSNWDDYPLNEVVFKGAEIPMPESVRQILERRYPPEVIQAWSRDLGRDLASLWDDHPAGRP